MHEKCSSRDKTTQISELAQNAKRFIVLTLTPGKAPIQARLRSLAELLIASFKCWFPAQKQAIRFKKCTTKSRSTY